MKIKGFYKFSYMELGIEKGKNIIEKSKQICELLDNIDLLELERQKYAKINEKSEIEKYKGFNNSDFNIYYEKIEFPEKSKENVEKIEDQKIIKKTINKNPVKNIQPPNPIISIDFQNLPEISESNATKAVHKIPENIDFSMKSPEIPTSDQEFGEFQNAKIQQKSEFSKESADFLDDLMKVEKKDFYELPKIPISKAFYNIEIQKNNNKY